MSVLINSWYRYDHFHEIVCLHVSFPTARIYNIVYCGSERGCYLLMELTFEIALSQWMFYCCTQNCSFFDIYTIYMYCMRGSRFLFQEREGGPIEGQLCLSGGGGQGLYKVNLVCQLNKFEFFLYIRAYIYINIYTVVLVSFYLWTRSAIGLIIEQCTLHCVFVVIFFFADYFFRRVNLINNLLWIFMNHFQKENKSSFVSQIDSSIHCFQ